MVIFQIQNQLVSKGHLYLLDLESMMWKPAVFLDCSLLPQSLLLLPPSGDCVATAT